MVETRKLTQYMFATSLMLAGVSQASNNVSLDDVGNGAATSVVKSQLGDDITTLLAAKKFYIYNDSPRMRIGGCLNWAGGSKTHSLTLIMDSDKEELREKEKKASIEEMRAMLAGYPCRETSIDSTENSHEWPPVDQIMDTMEEVE